MAATSPIKYVRFADNFFVLFPMEGEGVKYPKHADLAKMHTAAPLSAGFLFILHAPDGPEITCQGESLSLNLGPRYDDPEFFIKNLFL